MDLMIKGLHNRHIAKELGISPRTVEVHKARVMEKLGVEEPGGFRSPDRSTSGLIAAPTGSPYGPPGFICTAATDNLLAFKERRVGAAIVGRDFRAGSSECRA